MKTICLPAYFKLLSFLSAIAVTSGAAVDSCLLESNCPPPTTTTTTTTTTPTPTPTSIIPITPIVPANKTIVLTTTIEPGPGQVWAQIEEIDPEPYYVRWVPDPTFATPVVLHNNTDLVFMDGSKSFYLNFDNSTSDTGIYFVNLNSNAGISQLYKDSDNKLLWGGAQQERDGWMWCFMVDLQYRMFYSDSKFVGSPRDCGLSSVFLTERPS
ncbi:immunoreactive protein [Histoplasma ohiense]|uniref:Ajellomyces capsulatum immunoreactive clone GH17 n=1 Tax=Ajellomyces capsulatus TaxID=5037 RepID=Q00026_AJECA|nr:immunoreactive protein [Histoplasma capsulatum]KAG5301452.1 immunoreactive protein [Histoplasma ohiense (nom. inval.)]